MGLVISNGKVKIGVYTVVLTHGNPANMSMYETVKHLEGVLPRLAQEVFR